VGEGGRIFAPSPGGFRGGGRGVVEGTTAEASPIPFQYKGRPLRHNVTTPNPGHRTSVSSRTLESLPQTHIHPTMNCHSFPLLSLIHPRTHFRHPPFGHSLSDSSVSSETLAAISHSRMYLVRSLGPRIICTIPTWCRSVNKILHD
jgi:hypothetical protein